MAYRFKPFEKAVGVVVTFAVTVIIFLAIYVISVNRIKKMKQVKYYTVFNRGDFFQGKGLKITYNGFEIGKTLNATLLSNDRVKVRFFINNNFTNRIKTNCVLKLNASLIPGSESIALISGSEDAAVTKPEGRVWSSDDESGYQRLLHSAFKEKLPSNPLDQIIVTLNDLVTRLADEEGPVTEILISLEGLTKTLDNLMYDLNDPDSDLKQILAQVNKTLSDLNNEDSMFYEITHSKKMYNDILKTMNTLERSLAELEVVLKNLQEVRLLGGEKKR